MYCIKKYENNITNYLCYRIFYFSDFYIYLYQTFIIYNKFKKINI